MKNIKRLSVAIATCTIFASGLTYSLCKTKNNNYEKYLKSFQNFLEDDILIGANNGFSSLEVANTYDSLALAQEKDYIDVIKFDVRLTKDNKIVLSDDNILRKANWDRVNISDINLDEALKNSFVNRTNHEKMRFWYDDMNLMINSRSNNLNNKKYHLITLNDGIKACYNKTMIINIKFNNNIKEFTKALVNELEGIDISNIIFQSENINGISYLKDNTKLNCQLLVNNTDNLEYINEFDNIAIKQELVTHELIKELYHNGKNITILLNDEIDYFDMLLDTLQEYYNNVTYLTDYPDIVLAKLSERKVLKKSL